MRVEPVPRTSAPDKARGRWRKLPVTLFMTAAVLLAAVPSAYAGTYYTGSLAPDVTKSGSYSTSWSYTKYNDKSPSTFGSYARVAFILGSNGSWICSSYSDLPNFGCLTGSTENKKGMCKNIWTGTFTYIACSQS